MPRNQSKDVYRQLDTSVYKNVGQPFAVNIVAAMPVDGEPNQVQVNFDQPVIQRAGGNALGWTIPGNTFAAVVSLAADARSAVVAWSDPINIGDELTTPAYSTLNERFDGVIGGNLGAQTVVVTDNPFVDMIQVIRVIALNGGSSIGVEFDTPVAKAITSAPGTQFQDWLIASAAEFGQAQTPLNDKTPVWEANDSITSGLTYTFPGGRGGFVSITGAPVEEATGLTEGE